MVAVVATMAANNQAEKVAAALHPFDVVREGWEHWDVLFGPGENDVICASPTSPRPWMTNETWVPLLPPAERRNAGPAADPHGLQALRTSLSWSEIAVGLMARALDASAGTITSTKLACHHATKPDLLACMLSTWLPNTLDIVLLHDCTRPCLAANKTRSECLPPGAAPHMVHHAPLRYGTPPSWASPYASQLRRRCYYGPLHGGHNASYGDLFTPFPRAKPNQLAFIRNGTSSAYPVDSAGLDVPANRGHNYAKLASLLLAMSEVRRAGRTRLPRISHPQQQQR